MKTIIDQFKQWEGWIYMLLSLSMVLILVTGFFSYKRISDSLGNLNSRINQDKELTAIKNIRLNYIRLDNMMEMYLITKDTLYLTQFDTTVMRCKSIILKFKASPKISDYESRLIDSIHNVIRSKSHNLRGIITFQQQTSIEESINNLIKKRTRIKSRKHAVPSVEEEAKPKKTIWEKLWSKNKDDEDQTTSKPATRDAYSADNTIIKKQDIYNITQSASINPFLEKDHELNMFLMNLCRILETVETDRIDRERVVSERKIEQANQSVLLLGASTFLFILFAIIVYFWHIKKINQMWKNLANSKEMAEEMALIKEKFMANMSHEIRTPMNAISGFVDQLHASNLTIGQKKQIEIIQKSIQHILNIINDILDFSKLNAGKLTLDYKGFEIEKTVYQTIDILQPLAAEKPINIACTIDDNLPSILIGDAYRLRQILLNIIGNAIKYTEEGYINVRIGCTQTGINEYDVAIVVEDTGIGINEEDMQHIFKEYHMADNALWNRAGSSGLGLNITKMLVELHGGTITIDSTVNQGTTVRMEIPFKGGTAMDLEAENKYMSAPKFLYNKRILIADDEPFNRVLLNNILHKYNAVTMEAANGIEAFALIEEHPFDCVLMDIKMPEMNGIQASKKIRSSTQAQIAHTPIIAISAAITAENYALLQEIGVNSYLEKPFKEHQLLNQLYKVMNPDGSTASITEPPPEQPENPNKPDKGPLFDLSELQKQAGNNQHYITDMLNTLIDSTYKGIAEIEKAIDTGQWEDVNITAHRIASPLKFIYAKEVYDMIKQIETQTEPDTDRNMELINRQFGLFKEKFASLAQMIQDYIKNQ